MPASFTQTIRDFIISENLIRRGDHVLIGASGGADSMALLTGLHELRHDLGCHITAAHIHHGLRKSADRDMAFVQKTCREWGIPYRLRRITLKPKPGVSLEDAARKKRLSALGTIAKNVKADTIALGHHTDDLAETVLLRMIRGTGLLGLEAIAPKTTIDKMTLIRPFLNMTRKDIETFLRTKKIPFRQDPTNRSKRFLRNRIRLELLPLLKKNYHAGITSSLSHLALTAGQDYNFIEKQTNKDLKRFAKVQKGTVTFPLKVFIRRHPAIQRMLLRLMYCDLTQSCFAPSLVEIDSARKFLNNPKLTTYNLGDAVFSVSKTDITLKYR